MPLDTLHNALLHEMSDLLSAEKQIAKALQQVAKAATSEDLKHRRGSGLGCPAPESGTGT